jgi:hypothetical protein
MANRNIRKKNGLSGPDTVIPSWPMSTAAISVAVTAPRPSPLYVKEPKKYPSANDKKIAISG